MDGTPSNTAALSTEEQQQEEDVSSSSLAASQQSRPGNTMDASACYDGPMTGALNRHPRDQLRHDSRTEGEEEEAAPNNSMSALLLTMRVKTLDDAIFEVSCPAESTVEELKRSIRQKTELSIARQRLIFQGRQLQNEDSLATYSITSGATLHLVAR